MSDEPEVSEPRSVDLATTFEHPGGVSITPTERLDLAKKFLLVMAFICVVAGVAHGLWPANTGVNDIFELIKIGALPLITLVISFYFPKNTP